MSTPVRLILLSAAVLAASSLLTPSALALQTSIVVRGSVVSVETELRSEFSVGESFEWTYDYETLAPDTGSFSWTGEYVTAIISTSLVIGDYGLTTAGGEIYVRDDAPVVYGGPLDRYQVSSRKTPVNNGVAFSGADVGLLFPYWVSVELDDLQEAAFDSTALPATSPLLSDFEERRFQFFFAEEQMTGVAFGVSRVYGEVTSIEVVPEPSTAFLMSLGLVVLGSRRRP